MRICKPVCGISLFIVLLFGVFYGLLVFKPFYKVQYEIIPEIKFSGLSEEQYVNYTMQIVDYFFNSRKFVSVRNTNGQIIKEFFTKDEVLHMKNVKSLIRFFLFVFATSLFLFVYCLRFVKYKRNLFVLVSFTGIIFVIVLFLISLFDFSGAFIVFHKIFFRNSLWLLPENTKLIEMFPEKLFYNFVCVWFGIFFGINAVIYFASSFLYSS